jgi:SH3 domain protein
MSVKKAFLLVLVLSSFSAHCLARTAYISENLELPLRASDSERGKIVKMIPAGTPVSILQDTNENGYSWVQVTPGTEGFLLSRFLSQDPSSKSQVETLSKKLESLTEESKQFKSTQANNQELGKERDKLNTELTELHHTAANAIQLKQQRDELQERVVSLERELEQLKRENQALTDTSNQDWFLYGGLLSLIGVLLGFILPKLSLRRRSSGWDTF